MTKFSRLAALIAPLAFLLANQAFANPCPPGNPPTNCAPPPGAILDLDGMAIPSVYTNYVVSFTASATTTNISFAFREDPAFIFLDDVSVMKTGGGPELLLNGGFELGVVGDNAPVNWTFLNAFGATFAGFVATNGPRTGFNNYFDGAVQAYDGITQGIATDSGTSYDISFWLRDNSGGDIFRRISDNGNVDDTGGNGIDLLVYAGGIPTLIPEPEIYAMMAIGLALMGFVARRRRQQALA